MTDVEHIHEELKKSKKYRYLCDETLVRISQWAAKRFEGKKAVKAAKTKLHQVYGAYFEAFRPAKIQTLLDTLSQNREQDSAALDTLAEEIMKSHISTAERLPYIRQFYADVFQRLEKPKRLLDLACGLNPFAVPWMNLEPGTEYYAYDIDTRLIALLNTFFGYLSPSYQALTGDVLAGLPNIKADVVFLLKTLPCLEQQEKGSSEAIISALAAKQIVVSFPGKTLTGKTKGMEDYYRGFILNILQRQHLEYFELEYPNENVYIINKTPFTGT